MKCKSFILFFIGSLIALSCVMTSCEKKFDPRDTYRDITVVYGLINVFDSVHYIRINKAFLGDESIIVMAKDPDSSTYPVEDIDVRIYDELNGNAIEIPVETTIIEDKEPGYFYYPNQRVYYFEKNFSPNSESQVRIEITNKKTGKIIYAETPLVNTFYCIIGSIDLNPNLASMNITWYSAKNGKNYDVYYTFYYTESHIDTGETKRDSVVWHMGSYTADKVGDGQSKIIFNFTPSTFYVQLQKAVPYDENVRRLAESRAKLTIWSGSEQLCYYQSINKPSPGIVQDYPEYTNMKATLDGENIENEAFGIFASRIMETLSVSVSPKMYNIYLPETNRQFYPPGQ